MRGDYPGDRDDRDRDRDDHHGDEPGNSRPRRWNREDDDYDQDDLERSRRRREDRHDDADDDHRRREYPGLLTLAGYLWIICGALILLGAIIATANDMGANNQQGANAEAQNGGKMCAYVFMTIMAILLMRAGFRSITGTAEDTLGASIGSMIFGLVPTGVGLFALANNGDIIFVAVELAWGFACEAAGVMGLMARASFLDWKQGQDRPVQRRSIRDFDDRDRD